MYFVGKFVNGDHCSVVPVAALVLVVVVDHPRGIHLAYLLVMARSQLHLQLGQTTACYKTRENKFV